MTAPATFSVVETDLDAISEAEGLIVVFIEESGKLDQPGRRVNRLTRGALERFAESESFEKLKPGEAVRLSFPTGLAAEAIVAVKLDRRADGALARAAGVGIGKMKSGKPVLLLAGSQKNLPEVLLGLGGVAIALLAVGVAAKILRILPTNLSDVNVPEG